MSKIGFLTIGQSPRDDVVPEILSFLGSGIEVVEKGALDGLSLAEIGRLCPEKGDFPLITRLRDKSSAVVGKRKIIPFLKKKIFELEKQGVSLSALLCTEDFSEIKWRTPLLMPSRILFNFVTSLLHRGKLGVLFPLQEQRIEVRKKWEKTGLKLVTGALNPYLGARELEDVVSHIKRENVDLIVLDCIGYNLKIKEKLREGTAKPVLLPRSVLARFIGELL